MLQLAHGMSSDFQEALLCVESNRGKLLGEIMEHKLQGKTSKSLTITTLRNMVKEIGFPFIYHSFVQEETGEILWMWFVPVNPEEDILFEKIPIKESIIDLTGRLQNLYPTKSRAGSSLTKKKLIRHK